MMIISERGGEGKCAVGIGAGFALVISHCLSALKQESLMIPSASDSEIYLKGSCRINIFKTLDV